MKYQSKLNRKEIQELVRLLKKVHIPAPYPVFLALCKVLPIVAVDIAYMKDENHILLTHRHDEFYNNWHIPGSILWYKEKPEHTLQRIAFKELGIKIKKGEFVGYNNEFTPREQSIALLFRVTSRTKPKHGTFFHIDHLPKGFLNKQLPEIRQIRRLREFVTIR
jgi:ADP-ribose pyrophosphatase YjhB (NUDIX family)